jgi:hypothetical protein
MTQALYAHMNNKRKKIIKKICLKGKKWQGREEVNQLGKFFFQCKKKM